MTLCGIANMAAMTWAARRSIDWRTLGVYLAGGVIGVPCGVWLLRYADGPAYVAGRGLFVTACAAWMLLRPRIVVRRENPVLDAAIGFLGGFTGGAAGMAGVSVMIWVDCKGWDKARQRALFQPFILVMQIVSLLAINLTGQGGRPDFGLIAGDLLRVPAALCGTAAGLA
jgi:uncharacterized membrane protein YfcA